MVNIFSYFEILPDIFSYFEMQILLFCDPECWQHCGKPNETAKGADACMYVHIVTYRDRNGKEQYRTMTTATR